LSVAGAFDFAGKARATCRGSSWPVAGVVSGHADRRVEWEVLGFSCGPPMLSLARPALPLDLADSRVLRAAEQGRRLKLAGLVAEAALLAAGYHRHKRGEWRKRRGQAEQAIPEPGDAG